MVVRCAWADLSPALGRYHDREWGRPIRGDAALFERITLEGAQAGLSWATILNKRPAYRKAFAGFRPARVAAFTARDARRLLADAGDRAQPREHPLDHREQPRASPPPSGRRCRTRLAR